MKTIEIIHNIKNKKIPNDVYYTPPSVVEIHLNLVKPYYKKNDMILDPFYGQGIYYNSFDNAFQDCRKDYTEIAMNLDFFEYKKPVDMIISNPPFSCFNKVLEHCVSLNPHTISLIFGAINLIPRRIDFMKKHGYKLVALHSFRVRTWFAFSYIVVFSKEGTECMSSDIINHKIEC